MVLILCKGYLHCFIADLPCKNSVKNNILERRTFCSSKMYLEICVYLYEEMEGFIGENIIHNIR